MKRYIYIGLLFILFLIPYRLKAHDLDSVKISLLTCSPGQEIYSLFGHTAIRYEDKSQGLDFVFNYGMFSFNTPNFIWRFVKGETDYELGITEFPFFEMEYAMRGSSVHQQTLNLLPSEKQKLKELLMKNYLPENRIYRYNFFFDNCTTRARDKIEESIDGTIEYRKNTQNLSFRDIIHEYTANHPWEEFGIDLCLGSKADEIADDQQKMFAPFFLLHAVDSAKIVTSAGDHRALVISSEEIVKVSEPKIKDGNKFPLTPMQVSLALLTITLVICIVSVWKNKMLWGWDIPLFGIIGIAGCVIVFLVLFSVHPTVSPNYLLFLFNPIHLFYLPFMIYRSLKRKIDFYHWINLAVLTLFIMAWWILPQKISLAVLPLALCLMLRSATHLFLIYKRK